MIIGPRLIGRQVQLRDGQIVKVINCRSMMDRAVLRLLVKQGLSVTMSYNNDGTSQTQPGPKDILRVLPVDTCPDFFTDVNDDKDGG